MGADEDSQKSQANQASPPHPPTQEDGIILCTHDNQHVIVQRGVQLEFFAPFCTLGDLDKHPATTRSKLQVESLAELAGTVGSPIDDGEFAGGNGVSGLVKNLL